MTSIFRICRANGGRLIPPACSLRATPIGALRGGAFLNQRRHISVGDRIPPVVLKEDSPGVDINLADELANKDIAIIVGVPGAFSPGCTAQHLPGFFDLLKSTKNPVKDVYVVAVNDAFITKAWKDSFADANTTGVRFLADQAGEFAKATQTTFDKSVDIFGTLRNKRYALIVKNGKVAKVFEEPDNTSVNASAAEKVLEGL